MRIHHSRPGREFTQIPNAALRDERLSIAARGHLAYLLSLPDGWHTNADAEAERARSHRGKRGEGRGAMREIYAELKKVGYMHHVKSQNASGHWVTEVHVFDRPRTDVRSTDVRPTDVPVSRTSVPPAETASDGMPDAGDVLPGRTDVPDTGSRFPERRSTDAPVTRTSKQNTGIERRDGQTCVGDEVDDRGARGNHPRHEDEPQDQSQDQRPDALRLPQVANSQKAASSRLNDQPPAGRAQQFPTHDSESATAGGNARASDPASPKSTVGPSATGYRWRSPQEIAAEQAADSRAAREVSERAQTGKANP